MSIAIMHQPVHTETHKKIIWLAVWLDYVYIIIFNQENCYFAFIYYFLHNPAKKLQSIAISIIFTYRFELPDRSSLAIIQNKKTCCIIIYSCCNISNHNKSKKWREKILNLRCVLIIIEHPLLGKCRRRKK